jgi:hypothetical protein
MPVSPELRQRILETYPGFGWLIDVPEVGDLLAQASQEGWDIARLQAKLYATEWYRSRSETQRQMETLSHTDPMTFRDKYMTSYDSIRDEAARLGFTLTEQELLYLTQQWLMSGTSPDTDTRKIFWLQFIREHPDRITTTGSIFAQAQRFEQIARQEFFFAPKWEDMVRAGAEAAIGYNGEEQFRQGLSDLFAGINPHLADRLKAGETYADIVNPFRDLIAKELELGGLENVDMVGSNEWKWLLGVPDKDKPEVMRLPTQQEVIEAARKDTRWKHTVGATSLTTDLVDGITRAMGVRA